MKNYYPPYTHSFLNRSLILSRQFCHLSLFLLILVTFSCQEFDTNLPGVAIEENDIHFVDIDQAKMIAGNIEFPMPQGLDRSPQNTNQRDIDNGYLRGVFCSGQTLLKLHMNWGWGGNGNGLFNYNNWTVTVGGTTLSFNNNKLMVYNIIP